MLGREAVNFLFEPTYAILCMEVQKKMNKYEKLPEIIKEVTSYSEALKMLHIARNSGNFTTLKKYIKAYNLDISHFRNENYLKIFNVNIGRKIPLEECLVENSTYSRSKLKRRLFKEGLKKEECEICGQNNEWNGKYLIMILDHINGVNNDNRLENLRMVYPNCNYQLDTTGGRNKASNQVKRAYCNTCNVELKNSKAIYCQKCRFTGKN
jgi:hypothetical protein